MTPPLITIPTPAGGSSRAAVLLLARLIEDQANAGIPVTLHPTAARIVARLVAEAVMEGV